MTLRGQIRAQVAEGGCFTPSDFLGLVPDRAAARGPRFKAAEVLSVLAKDGLIRRIGYGVYASGVCSEREVVRAVLRKCGEPRFLAGRTEALRALDLPFGEVDKAALTTDGEGRRNPRRYATILPGWTLLQRSQSRRLVTVEVNAVLEVIRYQRNWPKSGREEIEKGLIQLLQQDGFRLSEFVPALKDERSRDLARLAELAQRAGWSESDLASIRGSRPSGQVV